MQLPFVWRWTLLSFYERAAFPATHRMHTKSLLLRSLTASMTEEDCGAGRTAETVVGKYVLSIYHIFL